MDELDRPPPVSAFDAFGAGALCVIAGIALTLAFSPGPWTRQDTMALAAAVAAGGRGAVMLRRLYRRQAAATRGPSNETGAAAVRGERETSRPAP